MDQERFSKRQKIQELGIALHPEKYIDTVSTSHAKSIENLRLHTDIIENNKRNIRLSGRMMTFRSHGKLSFAQLQDQEGRIQVAFIKNYTRITGLDTETMSSSSFYEKMLDLGDYIGVEGEMFLTNHGEPTLLVYEITFLGKSLFPMPEKFHGLGNQEQIYRQRYLDTISNEESRHRFFLRSSIIRSIREFFWKHQFIEVETPTLELQATGASAEPYHTHNNALDLDVVLRISHELPLKKIIIGGYERIFEIGKAFRNEGADPSHLPEHTHLEWYSAYWSYEENMKFVEQLIKHVIAENKINSTISVTSKDGITHSVDFSKEWERIHFSDRLKQDSGIDIVSVTTRDQLLDELASKNIVIEGAETMGYATIVDYLYKKVSRPKIIGPAFLYGYPKALQPLARTNDDNPDLVDQFQVVVNGLEISKGYSELVDPLDQEERFKEQMNDKALGDIEAQNGDDEYILAMKYGMPPISGVGIGIDRLVAILTEQSNLRDTVFFPLMRPKS